MIMARDELIGPIRREKFGGLQFLSGGTRTILGWNVMKNDPRHSGLSANRCTPVEPDRFFLLRTMIRNRRHDQVLQLSSRTVRDDVRMRPNFDEPPVDRCPIMRDESASNVVIAGTKCDRNNVRNLADQPRNFASLLRSGFGFEHVEQITGDAYEVEVWSLFDQPPKPVKAEMKVGCQKKLHGFGIAYPSRRNVILCSRTEKVVLSFMLRFST